MTIRHIPPAPDLQGKHQRLLDTLVELLGDLDRPHGRTPEQDRATGEALRAILSFLRHGVLAFAHGEERAMNADPWTTEAADFEHAFLEAEVESLAREVRPLLKSGDGSPRRTDPCRAEFERVRRRLHRIEAVLEMHVLREAEAAGAGTGVPSGDRSAVGLVKRTAERRRWPLGVSTKEGV